MLSSFRTPICNTFLAISILTAGGCATDGATVTSGASTMNSMTPMLTALSQDTELSTFTQLVQSAGLVDALSSGESTVFAPTNDAFQAVSTSTLDKLKKDPEMLKSVLSYHVVKNKISASSIEGSMPTNTLNGAKLGLARAGDFITVDDGLVIAADIQAGNGLIQKIDRVLMPPVKK